MSIVGAISSGKLIFRKSMRIELWTSASKRRSSARWRGYRMFHPLNTQTKPDSISSPKRSGMEFTKTARGTLFCSCPIILILSRSGLTSKTRMLKCASSASTLRKNRVKELGISMNQPRGQCLSSLRGQSFSRKSDCDTLGMLFSTVSLNLKTLWHLAWEHFSQARTGSQSWNPKPTRLSYRRTRLMTKNWRKQGLCCRKSTPIKRWWVSLISMTNWPWRGSWALVSSERWLKLRPKMSSKSLIEIN